MPPDMTVEATWEELWDTRIAAMNARFGPVDDLVLHATIPFEVGLDLGGGPDLVTFSSFTDGRLYVTAELIGNSDQIPNAEGAYELALVHKGDEDWGVDIISRLAYYTLEQSIDDGHTMDIGSATPEGSTIQALLFRRIARFEVLGKSANVLCCIGITESELAFAQCEGSAALVERLGNDFLLTDLGRRSVVEA